MAKVTKKNYRGAHYIVCESCKYRPLDKYFNPYCLDCLGGELWKKDQTEKVDASYDKTTKRRR